MAEPHATIAKLEDVDPNQRDSADVMDRKRKEHIAYEYLCHLEEAKK
jgi:hypothetical protein